MIAYLKGTILKKLEKGIILDTGNVGYLVHVPANLLANLSATSRDLELFIHSNIREDAFDLYGFATYGELTFFKTLLSVSGIGPKTGLEVMNSDVRKMKLAILNEDHNYIRKIPGIGEKTAKRMILELKNKVEIDDLKGLCDSSSGDSISQGSDLHPDAIDALIRLGYQRHHVTKTLRGMPIEITEAEEVITYFLKNN